MKSIVVFLFISICSLSFSQTDSTFVPGYYVVNAGAELAVSPSYGNNWEEIFRGIRVVEMTKYPMNYVGEEYYDGSAYENNVKIYTGVSNDYHIFFSSEKFYNYPSKGEVVVVYEYSNNKYYGFSTDGAKIILKGTNCLTKVQKGAGVGQITEDIKMIDGNIIQARTFCWIISQNTSNSTIKIQIENGKTIDIPDSKISFYSTEMKKQGENMEFIKVK